MKNIIPYRLYELNMNNKLQAEDYVNSNFIRLSKFIPNYESYSEEELKKILIDYFTEYPDQITYLNIKTVGRYQNTVPTLQNIGSHQIKYL